MLPQSFFLTGADDVLAVYDKINDVVIEDLARQLASVKEWTDADTWKMEMLSNSREMYDKFMEKIPVISKKGELEFRKMMKDAGFRSVELDSKMFKAAGLDVPALDISPRVLQLIEANTVKTEGILSNLSLTTASSGQEMYISAVNEAAMKVESGMTDYASAIDSGIRQAAKGGTKVFYPSGAKALLDVAIRRAVLTAASQTAGNVTLANCDDMGVNLVEVTAHVGARPEHMAWQGKVYAIKGKTKKYKNLADATGYGTGAGLCGWNCRHTFFPFFEGISRSAYPPEVLEDYESRTVVYNGEELSYYDATQVQRRLERSIREAKREVNALKIAKASATDSALGVKLSNSINDAEDLLHKRNMRMKSFLAQTKFYRYYENERIQF